jgi:uncharacterized protein
MPFYPAYLRIRRLGVRIPSGALPSGALPIGVTVELDDEPARLRGAWRVSDTELGNEVLALAHDRASLSLSIGFVELPDGSRWNTTRTRVERVRAALDHVAVMRRGAYPGARVTAVGGRT